MTAVSANNMIAKPARAKRSETARSKVSGTATPNGAWAHPDDLRDLMQAVTETTQRLQATHASLQSQVARLQQELEEANAALRRSQALAALGEMAAGIAHEVRNPLGSIQLYVQMLAEDLVDRPAQAEICSKIDRAVVGLDAIVRDVLAFARNTTIDPQPTAVDDILNRAVASCQSLLHEKVRVVRQVDGSALNINADAGLITQAIANVIRNAVEAMSDHQVSQPEIRLAGERRKVRCPDGTQEWRVLLAVEDRGPGIPAEVMDRIFNPFFTTRKTGTGLGLAIVHRIVDAHGGHVHIENITNGGARVALCLPANPPALDASRTTNGVRNS